MDDRNITDKIYDLMIEKGYPEAFARIISCEMNTEVTGNRMYGSIARHQLLRLEDVSDEIDYICNELSGIDTDDIEKTLTAAAYFHCNFEYIHPFADGNGRTGRTLMNYFLMIHDLPPTVIFDEDKKLYYEALSIFDETEKLDGFVSLLKDQTVKTWTAHRHLPSGRKKTFICL